MYMGFSSPSLRQKNRAGGKVEEVEDFSELIRAKA